MIRGKKKMETKRITSFTKLRVGEVGQKVNKNGRLITVKRIASTGFPQYRILANEPAR